MSYPFTDLPEAKDREFGAIYIIRWGGSWFLVQVTHASDRSISPLAGPFDRRPEIAIQVWGDPCAS